jgi:hypothetical protein
VKYPQNLKNQIISLGFLSNQKEFLKNQCKFFYSIRFFYLKEKFMCLNFRILGPAVRGLLQRYGLSPSNILASGPRGLLKGDVLLHIQKENLQPVPSNYIL